MSDALLDKTYDETLAHYGVPGMKWGVRRSQVQINGAKTDVTINKKTGRTEKVSSEAKDTAATKKKIKSNKISTASNKEIQSAITRMNLEQQYSKLTRGPVSKNVEKVINGVMNRKTQAVVNAIGATKNS